MWFNNKKQEGEEPEPKKEKKGKEPKLDLYDEVRQRLLAELAKRDRDPASPEYQRIMEALGKLEEARLKNAGPKMDPNKVLSAVLQTVSILGIAILDRHCPVVGNAWKFLGGKLGLNGK